MFHGWGCCGVMRSASLVSKALTSVIADWKSRCFDLTMNAILISNDLFIYIGSRMCCWSRKASRMRRLHRFLSTAFPVFLPATKAVRTRDSSEGLLRYRRSMRPAAIRMPFLKSSSNESLPRRILLRGSRFPLGRLFRSSLIANGQLVSAFGTTSRYHFTSVSRFHAWAEAMLVDAFSSAGLERAFHFL